MAKIMKSVEVLRAACCVAGLDKQITDRERAYLLQIAAHAGVGQVSLNAMIDRAVRDPAFFQEQFRIIRADSEQTMRVLFGVACADHELTMDERIVLHHFAQVLGMDDKRFNELLVAAERNVGKKARLDRFRWSSLQFSFIRNSDSRRVSR